MEKIKIILKYSLWLFFETWKLASFSSMIICVGLIPWKLEMTIFGLSPFDYTLWNFLTMTAVIFLLSGLEKWECEMALYMIDNGLIDDMFGEN